MLLLRGETQGKPEDRRPRATEEARDEVLENGEKPGEGLNCPCFGERPKKERPKKGDWLDT